jgi:hypothetical protein
MRNSVERASLDPDEKTSSSNRFRLLTPAKRFCRFLLHSNVGFRHRAFYLSSCPSTQSLLVV